MALLKDGTRIYGTLFANTEVVIGSMNVASQINASFLQANSANVLAQAAFDKANTTSANTVYTQGVDLTQNTRITSVENLVTSSYAHANAAFNQANVGATFVNTGGTVSGNVTFTKDVSVTGNLYVIGNTVSINTSSFTVQDALITLGVGNYTTDLLDIGFAGHYNDGTNAHAGFIRDASQKEFYIFQGYTPELSASNNVDINDPSFSKANLNAQVFKGNLIGSTAVVNGIELYNYTTSGFAKANTVGTLAQASFDAANTAAANTIYTQGVNDTQNTNITNVNTFAGSAYDKANTADTKAQASFNVANTNASDIAIIQGVNTTQNTNITNVNSYATGAYDKANSANVLAQAAYDKANTGTSSSTDQYARDTANTSSANTIYTQGVDLTQNTNITNVNIFAGSAFDKANTADVKAQAAFDAANTGGGGGGTLDQYARDTANTAASNITIIQGVNNTQNTNITIIQGVNDTQNTNITLIDNKSSNAYDKANSANVLAQAAFDKANTSITESNSFNPFLLAGM